jgi:3-dehydroquinate dehydratase-2
MKKCIIINGPNLNMLGQREPEIYGSDTLDDIEKYTNAKLVKLGLSVDTHWTQSNSEGEIVDEIQGVAKSEFDFVVINPAAYSHTSVAILDALATIDVPIVEVHISNTNSREDFRQKKVTAKSATAVIEGLGRDVYLMAIISQLVKD